jgi:hypothetical protein
MSESLPWTDEYVDGLHTRIEELERAVGRWKAAYEEAKGHLKLALEKKP